MEDSMLDRPDLAIDEKVSNKRVRDGEEEINIGRLEKRPSGILGVNGIGGGDCDGNDVTEGWEGRGTDGGIIDTFISNFYHQNGSVVEGGEPEVGGLMKSDGINVVEEDKSEDLVIDSGGGGIGGDGGGKRESGGGGGGGIITFISDLFQKNGSGDDGGDQAKSDLLNEVVEKIEDPGTVGDGGEGGGGGGAEPVDLDAEKSTEKINTVPDLSSKQLTGHNLKMRPDDYSERVFFLNNN